MKKVLGSEKLPIKIWLGLDEAAGAYKDIDVVMKNQDDLVRIVMKLKPLAVIKG